MLISHPIGMKRSTYLLFLRATLHGNTFYSTAAASASRSTKPHSTLASFVPLQNNICKSHSLSTMTDTPQHTHKAHNNLITDDQSLAHLVSSPERFAASHNMTIQQVQSTIEARQRASLELHHELQALDNIAFNGSTSSSSDNQRQIIGKMKHRLICQARYKYQRSPFVCRKCWTHSPICICSLFDRSNHQNNKAAAAAASLPKQVRGVYVWTHHEEWGRTANTGSMLPLGLEKTIMLMKGLEEHDEIFEREVLEHCNTASSSKVIPVVLWPGRSGQNPTVTIPQLREMLDQDQEKEIVLVAIEGTWNNARKMANRLRSSRITCLDISDEISSFYSEHGTETTTYFAQSKRREFPKPTALSPSLLAPLRRQGKGKEGGSTNVSTCEATIIALLGLGLDNEDGRWILNNAKEKVDRIREFTGKTFVRT